MASAFRSFNRICHRFNHEVPAVHNFSPQLGHVGSTNFVFCCCCLPAHLHSTSADQVTSAVDRNPSGPPGRQARSWLGTDELQSLCVDAGWMTSSHVYLRLLDCCHEQLRTRVISVTSEVDERLFFRPSWTISPTAAAIRFKRVYAGQTHLP